MDTSGGGGFYIVKLLKGSGQKGRRARQRARATATKEKEKKKCVQRLVDTWVDGLMGRWAKAVHRVCSTLQMEGTLERRRTKVGQ
jgi:hypothetical protein